MPDPNGWLKLINQVGLPIGLVLMILGGVWLAFTKYVWPFMTARIEHLEKTLTTSQDDCARERRQVNAELATRMQRVVEILDRIDRREESRR